VSYRGRQPGGAFARALFSTPRRRGARSAAVRIRLRYHNGAPARSASWLAGARA
jgi:hypothetical protein